MRFIYKVLPWLESGEARKKLNDKIDKIMNNGVDSGLESIYGYESMTIEQLDKAYQSTFAVKASLEEKIKSSLFSITLGTTIQALAVSLLFNDGINQQPLILRLVIYFIGIISLIYLLVAGYFAIQAISEEIKIYNLSVQELSTDKLGVKKSAYAACIELNNHANTIRNNILTVTYRSIVNGLILVALFFIVVGGASLFIDKDKNKDSKIEVDMKIQPNWGDMQKLNNIENLPYGAEINKLEQAGEKQNKGLEIAIKKIENLEKQLLEISNKLSNLETNKGKH